MLHCSNRYVRQMIIESLRYWATENRLWRSIGESFPVVSSMTGTDPTGYQA